MGDAQFISDSGNLLSEKFTDSANTIEADIELFDCGRTYNVLDGIVPGGLSLFGWAYCPTIDMRHMAVRLSGYAYTRTLSLRQDGGSSWSELRENAADRCGACVELEAKMPMRRSHSK